MTNQVALFIGIMGAIRTMNEVRYRGKPSIFFLEYFESVQPQQQSISVRLHLSNKAFGITRRPSKQRLLTRCWFVFYVHAIYGTMKMNSNDQLIVFFQINFTFYSKRITGGRGSIFSQREIAFTYVTEDRQALLHGKVIFIEEMEKVETNKNQRAFSP